MSLKRIYSLFAILFFVFLFVGCTQQIIKHQRPEGWDPTWNVYTYRGNNQRTGEFKGSGPQEGKILWKFEAPVKIIESSPAVVDGVVYFGAGAVGERDYFYALDALTGKVLWKFNVYSSVGTAPTVAGDMVYFGSRLGYLHALNRHTGKQVWAFASRMGTLGLPWIVDSSPAVVDGVVYFGSDDEYIYAVDAKTGKKLWDYKTNPGGINSSPTVVDGILYVGANDDHLHALDQYPCMKLNSTER
ncbi:PQQ-binding-like beta-propeller repeat protein [Deltaproteobacteria bacterium TL4]